MTIILTVCTRLTCQAGPIASAALTCQAGPPRPVAGGPGRKERDGAAQEYEGEGLRQKKRRGREERWAKEE